MGKRGPVAVADNVRALRGMRAMKRPDGVPLKKLVLPPKAPAMPAGLGRSGAAEWRRVAKELENAGVIAEVDRGALVAYCSAYQHMMDAMALLKKGGLTHTNSNSVAAKHPAWQIYREAASLMLAAANTLYLTPTSRLRIPVPQGATVDDGSSDDLFD